MKKIWLRFLDELLGCKWLLVEEYDYNATRWRDFRCARCGQKMTILADTPFRFAGRAIGQEFTRAAK